MIFQTLDDKETCVGSYFDGALHFDQIPTKGSATWNYHTYLPEHVKFAELYTAGKKLDQICPEDLKAEWDASSNRMKAMLKSFYHVGLTIEDFCFYELVPHRFLKQHAEIKNKITQHVLNNFPEPDNYASIIKTERLIKSVSVQNLKLNASNVRLQIATQKGRDLYRKLQTKPSIIYNQFGTRTGRLTTLPNSFPILTLSKKMRAVIEPYRTAFLEFDVVSAEVATLFYLTGRPIPSGDLHEWINKNAFDGKLTRDESKVAFFSWLYDPRKTNDALEKLFSRQEILEKYYFNGRINNPLGRKIEVGEEKALNYLVQSTFNDIFLINIAKLSDKLKEWGLKSNIAFFIHDSVVLDFDVSEKDRIDDIVSVLSHFDDYKFDLHMNLGKNYGDMREIK